MGIWGWPCNAYINNMGRLLPKEDLFRVPAFDVAAIKSGTVCRSCSNYYIFGWLRLDLKDSVRDGRV